MQNHQKFHVRGKTILITGGTGSLAKAILRQIKVARKVIILSRNEHKQVELKRQLQNYPIPVRFFLADVRDRDRLAWAFKDVEYVIHCAALKHIDMSEYNPFEAIQTNIMGTQNVIEAAIDCYVQKVLLISTDKAVNPINLYGATKLCSEKLCLSAISYAGKHGTKFSVFRSGNFYDSSGSVVELFRNLKNQNAGYVPITDVNMTRYFISLVKAAKLVIKALSLMEGGEIFIPEMHEYKITDIANRIYPEAKHKIIGLRDGEKLTEELYLESEKITVLK